ncbi:hypothetical protein HHK36_029922 [Tetracentron sinense]|uniref:Uncharacterized protein n=1 Tax=Tetracentron sinense TaxID=13715 RepID=A0A835CZS9_TETSI|nr:hypothetical protein HHK36_029922 [Tetracentron sinense]
MVGCLCCGSWKQCEEFEIAKFLSGLDVDYQSIRGQLLLVEKRVVKVVVMEVEDKVVRQEEAVETKTVLIVVVQMTKLTNAGIDKCRDKFGKPAWENENQVMTCRDSDDTHVNDGQPLSIPNGEVFIVFSHYEYNRLVKLTQVFGSAILLNYRLVHSEGGDISLVIVSGNERLINDYFVEYDGYFVQMIDVVSISGLSGLQKMIAAIRMLAYGMHADVVDEYVRIDESTTIESLKRFCRAIISIYEKEYLRSPTSADSSRLIQEGEKCGFPGMFGSLDRMHWSWKNCPATWHGQYTGHVHEPTIIFEAMASYDLWI